MAKKKDSNILNFANNRKIKNNLDLLDKNLADLYQQTYYTSRTDLDDSETIRSDIEKSVSAIMSKNFGDNYSGNIAKVYSKIADAHKDSNLAQAIEAMNNDTVTQTVMSTWIQGKWIKDLHDEIDMVLKYAPKLREALMCKKDCVLSADHFAKDFLSFTNILSKEKEQLFNRRMEELKKTYKLPEKTEQWYDKTSTYGEAPVYIIPYNKEFSRLLKQRNSLGINNGQILPMTESTIEISKDKAAIYNNETILESSKLTDECLEYAEASGLDKLKITINNSGILESATTGINKAQALYEAGMYGNSIGRMYTESYINEAAKNDVGRKDRFADKVVPDDLKMDEKDENETIPYEMLINKQDESSDQRININVPGCVVKDLVPWNLIPLYIEDICLGYYYVEAEGDMAIENYNSFEYTNSVNRYTDNRKMNKTLDAYNVDDKNRLINFIAGEIYKTIDAKFINDNQELRKEIYTILKHNELFNSESPIQNGHIKVSFLSADDVVFITFNMDDVTHRGKSDLEYSLFPAKLYACLYITNVLGIITRGQDKRVYYVKQNVETNIAQTMLTVMNQIKKGNFGARQLDNLGNILNITGKFNDILMPTNSSGEPPVTMEILEGQRFTDNSELMSMLEKQMIDPTEVPYDLIEARQSLDYAIQATMSNSRLMRTTYKRQDIYEVFLSTIFTKIYNYEYEENEEIKVTLPAPSFLNATNGQQLVEGTSNYIDSIINMELMDESDEVKAEFKRLAMRYYIPSHLNLNIIDRFIKEAKINVAKKVNTGEE